MERVALFGSMLTDAKRVSDVDLMVELQPTESDQEVHQAQSQQRIREALRDGRCFGNYMQELSWPQTEVWHFLKSRSRALSLMINGFDTLEGMGAYRWLYQHPGRKKVSMMRSGADQR